jgi:hypothetical protein
MSRKHINKYFQKYHIFYYSAIFSVFLYACNVTKKVPDGVSKNKFEYTDGKIFSDEIPDLVAQNQIRKHFCIANGIGFIIWQIQIRYYSERIYDLS